NIEKKEFNGKTLLEFRVQKTRYAEDPHLVLNVERSPSRPIFTRTDSLPTNEERANETQLTRLQTIISDEEQRLGYGPSQTDITMLAKEAGLGSRNTILKWLAQGEDSRWVSHTDGRTRVYKPLSHCPPVPSLGLRTGLDNRRPVQSIQEEKDIG